MYSISVLRSHIEYYDRTGPWSDDRWRDRQSRGVVDETGDQCGLEQVVKFIQERTCQKSHSEETERWST